MFHANRPLSPTDGRNRREGIRRTLLLAAAVAVGPLVLEACKTRPSDGMDFLDNEANIAQFAQATFTLLPSSPLTLQNAQTSTYEYVGMAPGQPYVDPDHVFGGVRIFRAKTGPNMPAHYVAEITNFGATGEATFETPVALDAISQALQGRVQDTPVHAQGYGMEFWLPAPDDPENSIAALPTDPNDTLNNAMVFLVTQASV